MPLKARNTLLAAACLIAGYSAGDWLTRHFGSTTTPSAAPTTPALLLFSNPLLELRAHIASYPAPLEPGTASVSWTQQLRINDGVWFLDPDGVLRRTSPATAGWSEPALAPHLRRGYYDLIDTRAPQKVDLEEDL